MALRCPGARRAASLLVLCLAFVGPAALPVGPARAGTPATVGPVALPRDHGAHPDFSAEWWYTAGTVGDRRGHEYFWFATVWSGGPGQIARVNVLDLGRDRIVLAREYVHLTRATPGQTQFDLAGFQLGWRHTNALGRWIIAAPVPGHGSLRLTLIPGQPYVPHGDGGVIQQGSSGRSDYYSEPRMQARGRLTINGHPTAVTGLGWLDHQWGNFFSDPGALRWNWFACQLQDGRELMLYEFLDAQDRPTGVRAGTLVTAAHRVVHLQRFGVAGLGPYVRPAGAHATYPLEWRLTVPAVKLTLRIKARARRAYIRNTVVPNFWEGPATITQGPAGGCIVESSREVSAAL